VLADPRLQVRVTRDAMDISAELKERVKSSVDLELLLEVLGFKIHRSTRKEIRAACIIHGGDNPTSFRMRTDKRTYSCYSHGCESSEGVSQNDVLGLVMKVKNVGFSEALKFTADLAGVSLDDDNADNSSLRHYHRLKDMREFIGWTERSSEKGAITKVSEKLISQYKENRSDYFTKQGVSEETQEFFEVGFYRDHKGVPRASIPIRSLTGSLIGISGRRTDGNDEPRYLLTEDLNKSSLLYNLHIAAKYLPIFGNTAIVVEGFKACWAAYEAGFPNTVACMGAYFLEPQAALLAKAGALNCVLLLDGDEAGMRATKPSQETAAKYMRVQVVSLFKLFKGKSPDDFTSEELSSILIDNAAFF